MLIKRNPSSHFGVMRFFTQSASDLVGLWEKKITYKKYVYVVDGSFSTRDSDKSVPY